MTEIRPLERGDIPAVARLFALEWRGSEDASDPELERFFDAFVADSERWRTVERELIPYQERGIIASITSQVAPGFARPSPVNAGMIIVRLVPWDQRTMKQQTLTQELYGKVSNFPGARAFPVNPGSLGLS